LESTQGASLILILILFSFVTSVEQKVPDFSPDSFYHIMSCSLKPTHRLIVLMPRPPAYISKAHLPGSSNNGRASCGACISRRQTARAHDGQGRDTRHLKRTERTRDGDGRSRFRDRDRRRRCNCCGRDGCGGRKSGAVVQSCCR
jgi:hypothetical protein